MSFQKQNIQKTSFLLYILLWLGHFLCIWATPHSGKGYFIKIIFTAFLFCRLLRSAAWTMVYKEGMTLTRVMGYIHTHVILNMRHNGESLGASMCYRCHCFDLFKMNVTVSAVLMKLLLKNQLCNLIQPPEPPVSHFLGYKILKSFVEVYLLFWVYIPFRCRCPI